LLRSYFAVFGIEPSWAQIDAVQSLLESERPQSEIHLNATCRFYRRYGNFYFAPPQTPERISEAFSILIPGECDIEPLGIRVVSEILPVSSRLERPAAWTAEFDADKVRRPVLLRTRRPGDTIRPLGMTGVKKVKKIMQERRLPREERERVPLIRFGDETAWIAGCCFSETFRIDQNTQSILRMTLLKRPFE